jgi:hypothetical protein
MHITSKQHRRQRELVSTKRQPTEVPTIQELTRPKTIARIHPMRISSQYERGDSVRRQVQKLIPQELNRN